MSSINPYIRFLPLSVFFLVLFSCNTEDVTEVPILPKKTSISYMKIDLTSGNLVQINQNTTNSYGLTTTGEDPYLYLKPLTAPNSADSVVLNFEYQCAEDINEFQIFLASPITEARSIKASIPAASKWRTCSVNLCNAIKQCNWGNIGDFLRFDIGNTSGVEFNIRNIYMGSNAEVKNDLMLQSSLEKYLSTDYSSQISEVKVSSSSITIKGNCTGSGDFALCEITPSDTLTQATKFSNTYSLSDPVFSMDIERFVNRKGFKYDRLLSKWVIAKIGTQTDEIVSHARYASQIIPLQAMTAQHPSSKKGLGGYSVNRGYQTDLNDLNITSATVNIAFTSFMYAQPRDNAIEHTYGNKTYYFDRAQVEELDRTMAETYSRNIVVAAILLVQKATECADPEIGRLLQHPNFTSGGIFTMPNMTNLASVNCYAAAIDFLASRYMRSDNRYGRIHHWIMHNEVDAGMDWTNMGDKPMLVYMDTYIKSMRMCYDIVREYDENSEVFASFTHSWADPVSQRSYSAKEMLNVLQNFSKCEGDFQWALAYHSYPEDLNEPKTWNDADATFSMNTPLITFKNLEVLNAWIKKPENMYKGTIKRTVWLSENGTNSRTYSDQDLKEQAAGFAYAWKKLKSLDGIDAIQWHNWIDNRGEYGLHIGLRRYPDDETDPGGRKPVWFAYKAAGTDQEDGVFDIYKSVIGIQDWNEVLHSVTTY